MPRVQLLVEVNTDPVPGSFHTPESVVKNVTAVLKASIGHYNPTVEIITENTIPFIRENDGWTADTAGEYPADFDEFLTKVEETAEENDAQPEDSLLHDAQLAAADPNDDLRDVW